MLALSTLGRSERDQQFKDGWTAYNINDYDTAFKLWRPLAEQGSADAQNDLGLLYANGYGVAQDDKQAAYWYRKSAEQGNANAQSNLAFMYEKGGACSRITPRLPVVPQSG